MNVWKPIETAPKDATEIIVCRAWDADGRPIGSLGIFTQRVAWWPGENNGAGAWIVYCSMFKEPQCFFEPTHWMEIPEPPKE